MKRAFFVIGPEGSGTYMLAEAFVSSGCTYCDKDDVEAFIKEQQPDLLVLRRSLPHRGGWPDFRKFIGLLESNSYEVTMVGIVRDSLASEASTRKRNPERSYYPVEALFHLSKGLSIIGGHYISYEYFTQSVQYRRKIFDLHRLPEPDMEFYDGNAKYYE